MIENINIAFVKKKKKRRISLLTLNQKFRQSIDSSSEILNFFIMESIAIEYEYEILEHIYYILHIFQLC